MMTLPNWVQTPRILLATIIWASIVLTASADFTNCTPPPAGLVSWWRGEGNALDQVGGNNGVLLNGAGIGAGVVGQAFSFNGTNSYVEVPNSPSLRLTNELTIEFWVKRQDLQAEDYIVNKGGDYTRGALNYGVVIDRSPANTLGFDFAGGYRLAGSIADLSWHHIGIVARHGDVDATFYVDGVQRPVTSRYGASTIDLYASTEPLHIGAQVDPLSGWSYYSGARVDELSLFNRALAAVEIQAIYQAGSAGKCGTSLPPSIVAQPASQTALVGDTVSFSVSATGDLPLSYQWRLNGVGLTGQTNTSLTLNNVQLTNAGSYSVFVTNTAGSEESSNALLVVNPQPLCIAAPSGLVGWWRGEDDGNDSAGTNHAYASPNVCFTNGIVGRAFAFDPEDYPYGVYTGVRIADQPCYALTNSLTIEGWIRPRGDGYVIFYRGDNRSGLDPYAMSMGLNNIISFGVTDANGNSASVSAPLVYNQWWYVAATLDGASGNLSLYTNGSLAAQITTTVRPLGDLIPQDSPGIGIGNVNDGFNNFPFHGDIDEISLYNRALSATEIQATYQASRVGKCQEPPSILVQVADLTVTGTSPATFTVTAAGTPQLRYQWRFNGADITGATDTSLTLANVQVSNAGSYSVRVVNAFGSVISSNALLTVILPCVPAPANLVGWWRGEGNALDQVGGNSGVLLNGAGFDAGVVGQGFSFNGTNSYVEVPNSPSLRLTNELTIEFWVKRQDLQAEDYIVNKGGDYTRGVLNYGVVIDRSPANTLGFDFAGGYRLAGSIADLSWHHIGIVARHGDVDATFYVDGVQRPVTSRYGASTIDLYASTEPLHIGAQVDPLSGWFYYSGARVDELSIFNRALAAVEIQAIYQAGSAGKCAVGVAPTIFAQPVSQAVAVGANVTFSVTAAGTVPLSYQWQFNSTNIAGATASSLTLTNVQPGQGGTYLVIVSNALGTVPSSNAVLAVIPAAPCATPPAGLVSWWPGEGNANDIAGINNGTLLNGATFALGKVGQAFSFDGASSYIQIADNPNLHFTNSLTIEAWIYPTSTAGYHNIVSKWDWDYAGAQMSFTTALNPGGRLGFGVCDNGNCPSGSGNVSAASLLPVNRWAHFAATYDGSYVAIYLNGVLENQVPYQNGIFPGTGPLIIGAAAAGGGQVISPFAGLIDEPAVYNRALSAAEIQAIYNAGSAGKCSSGVAPSIITQPVSQAVAAGANVTFSVTAAGTVPLSYQWSFDGSALAGATNASLTLAGVSTSQSGLYAVWVTNLYGAVLSSNASLAVRVMGTSLFDDFDPGIDLAQWSSFGGTVLANNYGGSVSGSNSLWFGGNGSRYAATVPLDTGKGGNVEFYLRIANGSGYPWELADLPGEGIVLEYSINGGTNWIEMGRYNTSAYFNWTPISVPIPAGAQANGAQFRWRQLSNSGASFDHWALDDVKILTGPAAPTIVAQPQNRVAVVGGAVTFSVAVTGTRPLSYQWSFNGSALGGATNESLTLTNLQISQAGSYGVVITNAGGAASSSNAILSVNFPPAAVRVVSVTNAPSGATINVPVSLTANGNENALSFSLAFDPAKLTYVSTVTGSGASGATLLLNTAQATSGKLGAILALPPGSTFAAGTQELVQVTFTAVLLTNAVSTTVSFGDVPIVRQLSDAPGNVLAATYAGGAVTIQAADFEGDLSPRPNGDKAVLVTDWVMAGRYAARLDYPTNAAEFQRADCAPRSTLGDGLITVSDWVQVGRYAAGLDPLTAAGGSTSEVTQTGNISKKDRPEITPKDHQPLSRLLEVADTMLIQGLAGTVSVQLQSQGNENAVGFSLSFDPAVLNYVSASLGSDSKGATLFVNASRAGAGRLGFVLAQGTGSSFVAGTRELVKVTFLSTAADQGKSTISLASQPVPCEVSDTTALRLAASYVSGTITVNPLPSLSIARSGENITLAWPLWATNFGLQTAEGGLSPAVPWTNLAVVPFLTSNETVVTLPLVGTNKLFRLHQP